MKKFNVEKLVGITMLAAIVVVLQFIGNYIKIGDVSVSLVLLPIVVGAAMYGPSAGAILGGVFGAVIIVGYLFGGTVDFLWVANPVATSVVCLIKGCSAGFVSGYIYRLFAKSNLSKNKTIGAYAAAAACPIVNTGIFLIAMFTIFKPQLIEIAGNTNAIYFAFVFLAGINFLVELAVNIILAPVIVGVMNAINGKHK